MKLLAPALVTAALLLAPQVVPAQSLGDVAAKEKEKKEKEKDKKPAKAYTEEDLRGKLGGTMSNPGATAGTPDSTATGDAAAASRLPPRPRPRRSREAKQKEWRERRDRTQQEVVRITASIQQLRGPAGGQHAAHVRSRTRSPHPEPGAGQGGPHPRAVGPERRGGRGPRERLPLGARPRPSCAGRGASRRPTPRPRARPARGGRCSSSRRWACTSGTCAPAPDCP